MHEFDLHALIVNRRPQPFGFAIETLHQMSTFLDDLVYGANLRFLVAKLLLEPAQRCIALGHFALEVLGDGAKVLCRLVQLGRQVRSLLGDLMNGADFRVLSHKLLFEPVDVSGLCLRFCDALAQLVELRDETRRRPAGEDLVEARRHWRRS